MDRLRLQAVLLKKIRNYFCTVRNEKLLRVKIYNRVRRLVHNKMINIILLST